VNFTRVNFAHSERTPIAEGANPNMSRKLVSTVSVSLLGLVALITGTVPAHAQIAYTDLPSFQAATATNVLYDFEGIAPANAFVTNPNLSPLGVSVAGGGDPKYYVLDSSFSAYSLNGSSTLNAGFSNPSPPTVTITFGSQVTAIGTEIGFRFAGGGPSLNGFTATLFNGTTQVGTTYTSATNISTGFIGFTSNDIFDRITFTTLDYGQNGASANDYQAYDNLRLETVQAVPEPGSIALLLSGMMGAGFAFRRRKRETMPTLPVFSGE
jgi:hypothetical protein